MKKNKELPPDLQKLKDYIKKNRIKYPALSKESGWSISHLAHVFCGTHLPSHIFMVNVVHCIHRIVSRQQKEFENLIKETEWKDILF